MGISPRFVRKGSIKQTSSKTVGNSSIETFTFKNVSPTDRLSFFLPLCEIKAQNISVSVALNFLLVTQPAA